VGYLKTGRLDQAERYVQSSLELNPSYLPAHEIHGLVLFFQGRFPEAADALAGLVKKTPCRKTVHYYLGRALENAGDLEKAQYHMDAAEALASKAPRELPAEASPDWLSGSFRTHRFP
jgi:tetratricopeptide (TPR) repeat protein